MKKNKITSIIISFIIVSVISSVTYADTLNVSCNIIIEDENVSYNYHGVPIITDRNEKIKDIWWTGKEYITYDSSNGEFQKSADLTNWESIYINRQLWENGADYTYMWMPVIEYYNGIYIIRDAVYENVSEIMAQLSWGYTLSDSSILVFDQNFNLIEQVDFKSQMTAFSYVDGKFYARFQDYMTNYGDSYQPINTVYVSEDAINWTVDESLSEVPLSNQNTVLTFSNGKYTSISYSKDYYTPNEIALINSAGEINKIAYENKPYINYEVANNLYISYESYNQTDIQETTFKVSLDGIYWNEIFFPPFDKYEHIRDYRQMGNKLLFLTNDRLLEYDIEEIKQSIIAKNGLDCTYVKMNGEILGFDTMPIMEEDRMLVPMRFLFEQMGAEVEWDGTTNTATAVLSPGTEGQIQTFGLEYAKTVTFSIDNTTAKVNGAEVTMDVPARLINDKTMVPLRFLSENLGYTVTWDDENKTAIIE